MKNGFTVSNNANTKATFAHLHVICDLVERLDIANVVYILHIIINPIIIPPDMLQR